MKWASTDYQRLRVYYYIRPLSTKVSKPSGEVFTEKLVRPWNMSFWTVGFQAESLICAEEIIEERNAASGAGPSRNGALGTMYNDMLEGNDDRMPDAGGMLDLESSRMRFECRIEEDINIEMPDLFEAEPGAPLYDMPFVYWWEIVQMMGPFPYYWLSLLIGFAKDIVDQEDEDAAAVVEEKQPANK
ncbi:hypothetical protein GIB67_000332 [Kingdonia uniflora]|uniref:Uncharacterized protein n=1 Tax=Kingdonia uniflora TaxID=39325 RepID=A0A7J7LCN3_9MAGN|nr:hypothetical protein GIB67_000332 [Kingdonia uniflora]